MTKEFDEALKELTSVAWRSGGTKSRASELLKKVWDQGYVAGGTDARICFYKKAQQDALASFKKKLRGDVEKKRITVFMDWGETLEVIFLEDILALIESPPKEESLVP